MIDHWGLLKEDDPEVHFTFNREENETLLVSIRL